MSVKLVTKLVDSYCDDVTYTFWNLQTLTDVFCFKNFMKNEILFSFCYQISDIIYGTKW